MKHTITAESTDPENYYKIDLSSPVVYANQEVAFCVTTFSTMCNILVLTKSDYITFSIDGIDENKIPWSKTKTIYFLDDYTSLDSETFVILFNDLVIEQFQIENDSALKLEKINVELTTPELIRITHNCTETKTKFKIVDMSYNMKLLCGAYGMKFPISPQISNDNIEMLTFMSVGMYLSTPIWYVIGKTGTMNFSNEGSGNVLMKIPNNFVSKFPIVFTNMDFITICKSTDLTNMTFELVDSNYQPIKILNPIYLSINVEPYDSMSDLMNTLNQVGMPGSVDNILQGTAKSSALPTSSLNSVV